MYGFQRSCPTKGWIYLDSNGQKDGRTCSARGPDMSENAYWSPVKALNKFSALGLSR
jgi:hypothetical protein